MEYVRKEVQTLQDLTTARVLGASQAQAIDQLAIELREIYVKTSEYWDTSDIQTIKQCLKINLEDLPVVIPEDDSFIPEHFYFPSSGNAFRVVKNEPGIEYKVDESRIYESADRKHSLWKIHISRMKNLQDSINRLTHQPQSAEDILKGIKDNIVGEISNKHAQFLRNKDQTPASLRSSTARHRVTYCYSCKASLDNEVNLECSACTWIVCPCGACGCGYEQ